MKKSLKAITKWLKDLGLKVNKSKTELCLFHRNPHESIHLMFNGVTLIGKQNMNVLGVILDSRLQWNEHVAQTIKKTASALHCIRQIKYYFTPSELRQIVTLNVY